MPRNMKTLLSLFIATLCLSANAASRITATITVTNNPSAANTLTVNAATRTWRASVTTPSTEVLIGANIGASATNLFRQLSGYALSGPVDLGFSSSNIITIKGAIGQSMAVSFAGTWATASYSTQAITTAYAVRVPFTAESAVPQTNLPSLLVQGLNSYSQSPIATNTTLALYLVQTDGNQSIYGTKTFLGPVNLSGGGTIDGSTLTNIAAIYAGSSSVINIGASAVFGGSILSSNTAPYFFWYQTDGGTDEKATILQANGQTLTLSYLNDSLSGPVSVQTFTRSGTTATKFSGASATNIWNGAISFTRANNTSLANGNNAGVNFGSKTFVKIKAGPTGAFAICGIAEGFDGRVLVLYNATGQAMTIANDSGVEPTAANRIYTNTGADVATTGNGAFILVYDSEDSRWVVVPSL